MKLKFTHAIIFFVISCSWGANAQGIVSSILNNGDTNMMHPTCASHDLMKSIDAKNNGFMDLSNNLMEQINELIHVQSLEKGGNEDDLYEISVVFHVVHNNSEENVPDYVIQNQLEVLNNSFRRKNADTSNIREVFKNIVGDSKIGFKLAELDPNGLPTNGITRTYTEIENFGGIIPFGPGQNAQITSWLDDSLFYNYFRITEDSLGGKSPWDNDKYLNIWIGDLRLKEPQFNNLEELIYFALATPPITHTNWPSDFIQRIENFNQGALFHYVCIGPNNPATFAAPYQSYNGVVTTGKLLAHEVGHYLGLRHIWGDGDCTVDDYVADTPNSSSASSYNCSHSANSCIDNINGLDLPNMVENYMDYSSGNCQNSFTLGQIGIMRTVLEEYRTTLATVISTAGVKDISASTIKIYPNPSNGKLSIDLGSNQSKVSVKIVDIKGRTIFVNDYLNSQLVDLQFEGESGIYFVEVSMDNGLVSKLKLIKTV